jgi:hypothetical protein
VSQKTTEINNQLIVELQGVTDEGTIRELTINAWKELCEIVPNKGTFKRTQAELRKAIKSAFPQSETVKPGYYFATHGKGEGERYEHLALWYATTNEDRWNVIGDVAREAYFANLPELPPKELESKPQSEPQAEPQHKSETKPQTEPLTLKDMTLQNLELDTETQEVVQNALNHSGMSLADFIKQACKVYAKTVMGKAKQADSDLSGISTAELLNNSTYRTSPGRVEELTNRAIQAIMHHNDMATEKSQKWIISATAINALTGCKMPLIKNVLEQCKLAIDDHHRKHELINKNGEVDVYHNRGREKPIEEDIKLIETTVSPEKTQATVKPIVEATLKSTPETTKQPTSVKPTSKPKIITLPVTASTIDIHDNLRANPGYKVRTKDGRKALTYVLNGDKVIIEETGESEALIA